MTTNNQEIIVLSKSIADALRTAKHLEVTDDIVQLSNHLSEFATTIPPKSFLEFQPILIEILQAQERQDWLAMADTLEVELTGFIQQLN